MTEFAAEPRGHWRAHSFSFTEWGLGMSHHGDYQRKEMSPELAAMLKQKVAAVKQASVNDIGAAGQFPNGRLCPEDQGEIQFAVGSDVGKGLVMLDFGEKPVGFVAMTPQQAADIAVALIKHARGVAKEPLSIVLH